MYVKPTLQRFGRSRELAQHGLAASVAGASIVAATVGLRDLPESAAAAKAEQSRSQTTF